MKCAARLRLTDPCRTSGKKQDNQPAPAHDPEPAGLQEQESPRIQGWMVVLHASTSSLDRVEPDFHSPTVLQRPFPGRRLPVRVRAPTRRGVFRGCVSVLKVPAGMA